MKIHRVPISIETNSNGCVIHHSDNSIIYLKIHSSSTDTSASGHQVGISRRSSIRLTCAEALIKRQMEQKTKAERHKNRSNIHLSTQLFYIWSWAWRGARPHWPLN